MGEPSGPALPRSTVLAAVEQALPAALDADAELLTVPFLHACRLVLPVIGASLPAPLAPAEGLKRLRMRFAAVAPAAYTVPSVALFVQRGWASPSRRRAPTSQAT